MASQPEDRPSEGVNHIRIRKEQGSRNLLVYTDGTMDESMVMQLLKFDSNIRALIYCADRAELVKIDPGQYRLVLEHDQAIAV